MTESNLRFRAQQLCEGILVIPVSLSHFPSPRPNPHPNFPRAALVRSNSALSACRASAPVLVADEEESDQLLCYKDDVDANRKLKGWEQFYNHLRPLGAFARITPFSDQAFLAQRCEMTGQILSTTLEPRFGNKIGIAA